MQIECFGIVRDRQNFTGTGAGFTKLSQQIPYRIIPKRMPPAASFTIYTNVVHELTPRTKLLHANEIRYMCFCRVRIRLNLRGLKIIEYIQYIVRISRQDVLQPSHKT